MPYPRLLRIRQHFDPSHLTDVAGRVRSELERTAVGTRIRAGESVAVGIGSRGIENEAVVVRTLVEVLRGIGASPFIVPAMGSHGGGTAEGQQKVLASYGISEEGVGAPVRSSMEAVEIGRTADDLPVWWDRHAAAADHVVVVNRIKPHTSYCGPVESGLLKMATIGLGKQAGASLIHRATVQHTWDHVVRSVGEVVLSRGRVAFGLAIVENAYDRMRLVEAVPAERLFAREPELLVLAREWMPRLPVSRIDLLVIDEMGKHISGLGMDTNITGRKPDGAPADAPHVERIFVRDLAPGSHGNAHGVGLADFTTSRLVRAMDYRATVLNSMTALHPEASFTPIHFETDREAIDAALGTLGLQPPEQARIVRIRNTLRLGTMEVSEACRDDLSGEVEVLGPSHDLAFDAGGNLAAVAVDD